MQKGISRRQFLAQIAAVTGGLAAMSILGAGCAPAPTPVPAVKEPTAKPKATEAPVKAEEKISLRVQAIGGSWAVMTHEAVKLFAKDYPNIEVQVIEVPYGEIAQKTAMGFATDDLPDTLHAFSRWHWLGCYKGWYLPLDELLETTDAVADYDDFYQISVENEKFEGKTYCLLEAPLPGPNTFMTWNRGIFENAGVEPPNADMDIWDLFETVKKVAKPDDGIFGFMPNHGTPARMAAITRMWGEPKYGLKGDTSTWITSTDGKTFKWIDNVGAIEYYKSFFEPLLKDRVVPKAADDVKGGLFAAGRCAVAQVHSGQPVRYKNSIGENWDYHVEDSLLMVKGPDGRHGTAQESQVKCVYSKTKYPEWALKVLGYLTSEEAGLIGIELKGNYSGRRSVFLESAKKYPHFKLFDEVMHSGNVEPYPIPWNLRDVEVSDVLKNTLEPIWTGVSNWDKEAQTIQDEIQKVFDLPRP